MPDEFTQAGSMGSVRAFLEAGLQTSSEAVIANDREGRVISRNPGATRMFGFNAAAAVDRAPDPFTAERLGSRHWRDFHRALAAGRSRHREGELLSVPAVANGGHRISVEFVITRRRDDAGAVIGMVAVTRDVTKRFEEQKLLRRKLAELEAARIANRSSDFRDVKPFTKRVRQ